MERAWEWKKQYGGRIVEQLKKLGSSCDWQRERFTMDEGCSKAVQEVFVKPVRQGPDLPRRAHHQLVPPLQDLHLRRRGGVRGAGRHLLAPALPGEGRRGEYLELATTRPETMLGDTAVAVNPEDERYTHLHGKTVILPLVDREIPVVGDEYVDMEFGTGVVKITPAHDPNDFEVGAAPRPAQSINAC